MKRCLEEREAVTVVTSLQLTYFYASSFDEEIHGMRLRNT